MFAVKSYNQHVGRQCWLTYLDNECRIVKSKTLAIKEIGCVLGCHLSVEKTKSPPVHPTKVLVGIDKSSTSFNWLQ